MRRFAIEWLFFFASLILAVVLRVLDAIGPAGIPGVVAIGILFYVFTGLARLTLWSVRMVVRS